MNRLLSKVNIVTDDDTKIRFEIASQRPLAHKDMQRIQIDAGYHPADHGEPTCKNGTYQDDTYINTWICWVEFDWETYEKGLDT